jgi:predicted homoserine dehydrogenase-like protein
MQKKLVNVGIIGTGFIATGLYYSIIHSKEFRVSVIRTKRKAEECKNFNTDIITNSDQELIEKSDIIVECSGNPVYATPIVRKALESGIKVVTMDSELQITTGSYLKAIGKNLLSEAEGDQPGCLASLNREAIEMGFIPLVYGNIKGFLNYNPSLENMKYWSKKNKISLNQVTSFTDGTKICIEQVLVANGLNVNIAQGGMIGFKKTFNTFEEGAFELAEYANINHISISDFVMYNNKAKHSGVFMVCKHENLQQSYLEYYKMGSGPFYLLEKPFHLCHLEIMKTIKEMLSNTTPLLTNGLAPRYSVNMIAKVDIPIGTTINRGIGSFLLRGQTTEIKNDIEHVPAGLMFEVTTKKQIKAGQIVHFDDIIIPESEAYEAWMKILNK